MTQKEIRDIAAYWGSEHTNSGHDAEKYGKRFVDIDLFSWIVEVGDLPELKLRLRPIQSLTDEELTECARIDAGGEFRHGGVTGINRYSDELEVTYAHGAIVRFAIPDVFHTYQDAGQVAQTIAYLQSIGVYVPGTIDEKYVELI